MPSANPHETPTQWSSIALPSPLPADPPDVPGDIRALAEKVAEALEKIPFAIQARQGVLGVAVPAKSFSGPIPQTYVAGRFTQPPTIVFGQTDSRLQLSATNQTTSGFNLSVRNMSDTDAPAGSYLHWVAIQMTASSAQGDEPINDPDPITFTVHLDR